MSDTLLPGLISTEALAEALESGQPPVVLDTSWHLPASGRNGHSEYLASHIPGARFFDIDLISDHSTSLPHMLPSAEEFAAAVSALGIGNGQEIVLYDSLGIFSAPRVWWMFRCFGHDAVKILDGGLPKWRKEGRSLAAGMEPVTPAAFTAAFRPECAVNSEDILARLQGKRDAQILDARSPTRFNGQEKEPRPDVRIGHIPGSTNMHYRDLMDTATGCLLPVKELHRITLSKLDMSRPVITSCGSGVTAAILSFVLHGLGKASALYDGSWAEWGRWNAASAIPLPVEHALGKITGFYLPPLITVEATFTELDMTRPLGKAQPEPPMGRTQLVRANDITARYYRYLYLMVGRRWHWTERLLLDDTALQQLLSSPEREVHVLYQSGSPLGFFELYSPNERLVQIPYVGMREDKIGKGLGRYLIETAVIEAWRKSPEHVTLHTTSLDHPNTLPMLQKAGFSIHRQRREITLKFMD